LLKNKSLKRVRHMQIVIESSVVDQYALSRASIQARVRYLLRRHEKAINLVRIRLAPVSAPLGGANRQCQLLLRVDGIAPILITARARNTTQALEHALQHAAMKAIQARKRQWVRRLNPLRVLDGMRRRRLRYATA
jgi:hypothetical protein